MKNFWNIYLLISGILAIGTYVILNNWVSNFIEPIEYDMSVDKEELSICNPDRIFQYYNISTAYSGGKRAIKQQFLPGIEKDQISFGEKDGNIAIRFIVNCNGEIGLFRAKGTDKDIKATDFDKSQVDALIKLVSELDGWQAGGFTEKTYDSYYYINFKIEKGRVTDIF